MFINDLVDQDSVQDFILQDLKKLGVKYRVKKASRKVNKNQKESESFDKLFKTPLTALPTVTVEGPDGSLLMVPAFIPEACNIIRSRLETEGIFRLTGSSLRQKELKKRLDIGEPFTENDSAIEVANVLKQFFRELPEPLLPYTSHDLFLHCLRLQPATKRLKAIQLACLLLPIRNLNLLIYIAWLLHDTASLADTNKMTTHNLALMFAPNIMPMEDLKLTASERMAAHVDVIEILLANYSEIGYIPEEIIEKVNAMQSSKGKHDHKDKGVLKSKKRRSDSLTRVINGLKKIVSGRLSDEDPETGRLLSSTTGTSTPSPEQYRRKRKGPSESTSGLSYASNTHSKRKRKGLHLHPTTPGIIDPTETIYFTPTGAKKTSQSTRRHSLHPCIQRWFSISKPGRTMLTRESNGGGKAKRNLLEINETEQQQSALKRLERRWSLVSNAAAASWRKRCHLSRSKNNNLNDYISSVDNEVFDTNNVFPCSDDAVCNDSLEFVKIPKSEYEEIKNRVSAIENRISQEFTNIGTASDISMTPIVNVQIEYEKALEESEPLNDTSTDRLAKRLSRELKIRRSAGTKIIRSPSARKIGTIRRRSRELERKLSRNDSQRSLNNRTSSTERTKSNKISPKTELLHLSRHESLNDSYNSNQKNEQITPENLIENPTWRSALRRGRPNTVYTGLPSPRKGLRSQMSNQYTSLTNISSQSTNNINKSKRLSESTALHSPFSVDVDDQPRRASLAKLRNQNIGMVLERAKLFDNALITNQTKPSNKIPDKVFTDKRMPLLKRKDSKNSMKRNIKPNVTKVKDADKTDLKSSRVPLNRTAKKPSESYLGPSKITNNAKSRLILEKENNISKLVTKNREMIKMDKIIRKSNSPLKDLNRIEKVSPICTFSTTPHIKKHLINKSPRYKATPQNTKSNIAKTPIKAIHGLQCVTPIQARRQSPRLLFLNSKRSH